MPGREDEEKAALTKKIANDFNHVTKRKSSDNVKDACDKFGPITYETEEAYVLYLYIYVFPRQSFDVGELVDESLSKTVGYFVYSAGPI